MEAFDQYIEKHRKSYLEELRRFCRQPSISNTGKGMQAMAEMVAERLSGLGAEPRLITVGDSYPYVYAEIGEGRRTLLIYNHYDVQPAHREDGWAHDPFDPVIQDGRLYARGVADNKANLLFRIQSVEAYLAVYGRLPLRVRFLIEGEEEIGSPHLPRFVESYADLIQADGCIWESGRTGHNGNPVLHLGLRGILYVELSIQADQREMHSSWANIVENPALPLEERLRQALQTLMDEEGRPALNGLETPPPSQEDLALLETIPFDPATVQVEHGVTLRPGLSGVEALRRVLFEPSCNICGLGAGYTGPGIKTVIPNRAVAKVDFRLPFGLTPDEVEIHLRRHLQAHGFEEIQIRRLAALHPARFSPNAAIVRAVREAVRTVYGVEPTIYPLMPASGPMYTLCQVQDIPAVTFGTGYPGDNTHAANENIRLKDYFRALRCFGRILDRFASLED